jgi:putative peptidoglycan lipid II flippase
VPWLIQTRMTSQEQPGRQKSGSLIVGLGLIAVIMSLAVILLREPLTLLLAPGFGAEPGALQLASMCLSLAFPIVGASLLTAFATAWLSLERDFLVASLSGLLVNGMLICALFAVQHFRTQDEIAAQYIAVALTLAGVGQAVLLLGVMGCRKGAPVLAWPAPKPLIDFTKRLLPSLGVAAAPQLVFLVVLMQATQWPGSASQLIYAERLLQLPFGFIAAGLSLVALPEMTRLHNEGQQSAFSKKTGQALLLGLALAVPATLSFVLLAEPITVLLFQHGAFSATAAQKTAAALQMLALALPLMVAIRVYGQAFFAQHHYYWPFWATLTGLATAYGLSHHVENDTQLALVFTLATGVEFLVLALVTLKNAQDLWRSSLLLDLLKLFFSNVLVGLIVFFLAETLSLRVLVVKDRLAGVLCLALIIGAVLGIYGLVLYFSGLMRVLLAKNPSNSLHDA